MIHTSTPTGRWVGLLAHASAGLLFAFAAIPICRAETLEAGTTIVRRLSPGESLAFDLPPSPTTSLRIIVEESGIDVVVSAKIGGRTLRTFDGDIVRHGRHLLAALAPIESGASLAISADRIGSPPGDVRIVVTGIDAASPEQSGAFGLDLVESELAQRIADPVTAKEVATATMAAELRRGRIDAGDEAGATRAILAEERALTAQSNRTAAIAALKAGLPLWRRLEDRRGEASALNNIGMQHFRMGDGRLADRPLRDAQRVIEPVDDDLLKAIIQNNICLTQRMRGDGLVALKCFERALELSESTGDLRRIATAYNNLGGALSQRGETERAASAFERAIAIREQLGESKGNGDPLANLGLERQAQGRFDEAMVLFDRSLSTYREADDLRGQALATRHQGQLHMLLGDFDRAASLMRDALALQRRIGRRDDIVHTLIRLGETESLSGRNESAVADAEEALSLAAIDGDPRVLAETSLRAARLYSRAGQTERAFELAERASSQARTVNDRNLDALAALEVSRAAIARGDGTRALAHAQAADRVFAATGMPLQRADALALAAQAHAQIGKFDEAEHDYARGLDEIERARSYVFDPELRSTFLATQSRLFLGQVSLLMQRAETASDSRLVAKAFAASERYRARVLLDRLESAPSPSRGDDAYEHQRSDLIARLSALALARWGLGDGAESAERRVEISRTIAQTEDALRLLGARAGEAHVHAGASAADLRAVQDGLPQRTQLVDYLVTESATYVWIVSKEAFSSHRLPGRVAIAGQVNRTLDALGIPGRNVPDVSSAASLEEACRVIWMPIADRVREERVVIVANDALAQLPFAALRCENEGETRYLVERHELSLLPSASLLAIPEHSRIGTLRPHAAKALVVADPIYSADDSRLSPTDTKVAIAREGTMRGGSLSRLPGGHAEAESIRNRFGAENVVVLEGERASLSQLRTMRLSDFSILHFATHGLADTNGLSGSGLVLSLYDGAGQRTEGFLSMREIAEWRLDADLVLVGACDSAAGVNIAGEGVMGVAYGMLTAGARSVIAPLWAVDDAASSTMSVALYSAIRSSSSPAAALRAAQLQTLSRDERRREPRYWAAYIAIEYPSSSVVREN